MPMDETLYQSVIGLYIVWLLLVVLMIAGRYTSFPLFDEVHSGVVFGAAVLAVLGVTRLIQTGYQRIVE